ncbi:hypothetical protein [Paraburkholderia tuberum]|uniref:Transposase n=1 Tax=Paraburkholderia tuberum TaxID=157910 RepID=A0A1H1KHX7_9BURK|nr:hypothetical protein [Paraburkholderia tuberum]SDR61913.1 hypothetical protein SAMN05445850_8035 [Paraburkholderia tuberum]
MNRSASAAAKLPEHVRQDLAVRALAGSGTISALAGGHGVSRKFVYAQTRKARVALADAFASAVPEDEVLFELPVSQRWLRQVMVALTLICRSSYRGVVEFMRDLLGVSTSVGNVHDVQQWAAQQAAALNCEQDLSGIRVGLHDEIFQGSRPVLAGVDAESTYCYLLSAEAHRDGDTWGVHLLDAAQQGLAPDYTIADAGQGLRAGQRAAWGDTPCHGDVFHIQRLCEGLANTLGNLARGARSRREKLDARLNQPRSRARDGGFATQLRQARRSEAQAHQLACDIRTLTQWLSHDILALAGPRLATREALFDFIVEELRKREPLDARRIRPVRVALQNQRDDLLAFAGVLDKKLAAIAQSANVSDEFVRAACVLHRKPRTSSAYWQGWGRLRASLGGQFHAVFAAVSEAMAHTPRGSALVENLNSRLRNYFTLRRHLGAPYLDLLRFFLNHRRFVRSRRAERQGRSPCELMTGRDHPHWLTLLGLGPLQPQRV